MENQTTMILVMGSILKLINKKVNIQVFKHIFCDFCGLAVIAPEENKIYYLKFKNDPCEIFPL